MVMLDDRWIKYEGDIRGYDGKGVKQEEDIRRGGSDATKQGCNNGERQQATTECSRWSWMDRTRIETGTRK